MWQDRIIAWALALALAVFPTLITLRTAQAVTAQVRATVLSYQQPPIVASGPYTGPGDAVSGASTWYGLRAYSAAKAGTRAINLCDNTGANCTDISTSATTGQLNNPGTLGSNNCATSGTCEVATWYDQSGALSCGGSACDVTQATTTSRPTLLFNCINSRPCLVFNGVLDALASSATFPTITSGTMSTVAIRTAAFTTQGDILSIAANGGNNIAIDFRAVASAVQMFQGTTGQFISNITDNNYHALQAVFNGVSSVLFCGGSAGTACSTVGTSNSISPGVTATGANGLICIGIVSGSGVCATSPLSGQITEVGMWNGIVFTGTQQTNMNANQYTFWGPF